MKPQLQLRWLFAAQALFLAVAAWRNLHQLNPDAIAYLRIAGYYAGGQWELAVTGYWGPLLSWLMVPLLKAGSAPLVAARMVMAVSGVVFLCGAVAVFRTFRLPRVALLSGAWMAAGWSVFWSVRNITPDLLLAGLVALAVSATVEGFLFGRRNALIAAGMWWGVAYLAKAVALPLAGLTCAALAVLAARSCAPNGQQGVRTSMLRRLAMVWFCCVLVASPWMAVLSLHCGKLTFSTTGPIAHALAGPPDVDRYHPAFGTLHQPDVGRVTQWEEPSRMAYQYWSPFASAGNFQHQLYVMAGNAVTCARWLGMASHSGFQELRERGGAAAARALPGFDLAGLSLLGVTVAAGLLLTCRRGGRDARRCWAVVPVICLGALYLPFWVQPEDGRYFYPAFPFVWTAVWAAAAFGRKWRRDGRRCRLARRHATVLIFPFAATVAVWTAAALHGLPNPASEAAHAMAGHLRTERIRGPLAGSGAMSGGRTGLYTAFLLGERWLGDDPQAGSMEFLASGARVVMMRRNSSQAESFARDPRWRPLETGMSAPLQVFIRENP